MSGRIKLIHKESKTMLINSGKRFTLFEVWTNKYQIVDGKTGRYWLYKDKTTAVKEYNKKEK